MDRTSATAGRMAPRLPIDAALEYARAKSELVVGRSEPDPGGPKRITDTYAPADSTLRLALALLFQLAFAALLVQIVIDVIRARRG